MEITPKYEPEETSFLEGVNPALLQELTTDKEGQGRLSTFGQVLEKELEDKELREMYEAFIKGDDKEALKLKSEGQLRQLENLYYDDSSNLFQLKEFTLREEHLMDFIRRIEKFDVVIGTRTKDKELEKFDSARKRGEANSFGVQDALIHADKYVFASFREIPHFMTGHSPDFQVKVKMDAETKKRSQIVFQDFANILVRDPKNPIRSYVSNMFDYETGKRVLATYLAMTFNDPEEAELFLQRNNHPRSAEQWDKEESGAITFSEDPARVEQIINRMKEIKEKTGIEPPLSLEVQIKDEAFVG